MSLSYLNEDTLTIDDVIDVHHDDYSDLNSIDDEELKLFRRELVTPAASVYSGEESRRSRYSRIQRPVSRNESVVLFKKINDGDEDVATFDLVSSELRDFIDTDTMYEMISRPISRFTFSQEPNCIKRLAPVMLNYKQRKSLIIEEDDETDNHQYAREPLANNNRFTNKSQIPTLIKKDDYYKQIPKRSIHQNNVPVKAQRDKTNKLTNRTSLLLKNQQSMHNHSVLVSDVKDNSTNHHSKTKTRLERKPSFLHDNEPVSYHNQPKISLVTKKIVRSPPTSLVKSKREPALHHPNKSNSSSSSSSSSSEEDFIDYHQNNNVQHTKVLDYQEDVLHKQKNTNIAHYNNESSLLRVPYFRNNVNTLPIQKARTTKIKQVTSDSASITESARQLLATIRERREMTAIHERQKDLASDFRSKLSIRHVETKTSSDYRPRYVTRLPQRSYY